MSPQMQTLLANYAQRLTTYVTMIALAALTAFFSQDAPTRAAEIASLGFSPVWIPIVTAALHFAAGLIPQPSQIKQVPDAQGEPPTPPSAGFIDLQWLGAIAFALIVVFCIGGCTTIPTGTFTDKAALAENSVLAVQKSATALLRAGKITQPQDAIIQKQLGLANDAIKLAASITDPTMQAQQLQAAVDIINALKTQTGQ